LTKKLLEEYSNIDRKGFQVETKLGFGKPNRVIPELINAGKFDILVMGTHGHTWIQGFDFGTTVNKLRHKISIPLLIVKN
jgi:manganese transport protein